MKVFQTMNKSRCIWKSEIIYECVKYQYNHSYKKRKRNWYKVICHNYKIIDFQPLWINVIHIHLLGYYKYYITGMQKKKKKEKKKRKPAK